MAKQRNRYFLADREILAHLLPSIILMIIARKKSHIQDNHTTNRKTITLRLASPSTSLRPKDLAQATRTLAQASSLRLGESSTSSIRTLRAFSLRRDPPCLSARLSETFARSKVQWVAWMTIRGEMLRRAHVTLA
ncbi:hypothetical protein DEO72_LG6g1279 [Vigna unguiculata]|uniref:Uncharacterized protein n=1 Tax=Vigna unguiculata TaxID=3917 RepID=A0A4D6M6Y6_VIGUN|nr:hypothetical protein DEO72_LG6g1279 [Vigna unguiculata]